MRNIFTLFVCGCLCLSVKSQTITVPSSHFFTGPYGPGSHISVPIKLDGCFAINNRFELFISDNTGNFPATPVQIGGNSNFFTPYVNGFIPASTTPGNYRLMVRSTAPVRQVITPLFTVGAQAGSPFSITLSNQQVIADSIFGDCTATNDFSTILGASTSVHNSTVVLDSLFNTTSYTQPNGSQISFTAVYGNYYTAQIRTQNANGVWSIRSYLVLASTRNLSLQTAGTNEICYPEIKSYTVNMSGNGGIANNYPGTIYTVSWGDGISEMHTHCELLSSNGQLSHLYHTTSCGRDPIVTGTSTIYNAYQVNIEAFNVCPAGSFTPITTYAKVWSQPDAQFTVPNNGFGCINTLLTFNNASAGNSAPGNAANCSTNATFEWYVDGALVSITNSVNQSITYTFNTLGIHAIKLIMKSSPCMDSITRNICIEPVPIPDFKMNGLDSVSGCPPQLVALTNLTSANACRDLEFLWEVLNSAGGPAPPATYTFTTGNDTVPNPVIQFNTPGKYFIRLSVTNSCGTYTIQKPVLIRITPPAVSFPANPSYCGTNRTIDFGTAFNHIPQYNEPHYPGNIYNWQVTGGPFSFAGGTTSGDRYPQILFTGYGTYTVSLTYTTICGTVTASQTITINESVGVDAGPATATVCYNDINIQLNGSLTGPVDSVRWSTTGSGSFTDPDQVSTTYTFSTTDKNTGQVKLFLTAYTGSSSICPAVTDSIIVTIQPRLFANNNTRAICSNQAVNYTPTGNQGAATYTWTSVVTAGSVTGNTASGSGTIGDVLVNSGTIDGVVVYSIVPNYNGCSGDTGRLTVTVKPVPTLTATPDATQICSGDSVRIQMQSNVASVVFNWTAVAPASVTGYTQGTYQSYPVIRNRLFNNGVTIDTVTYTITAYTVAGPGIYCAGETKIVKIAVVPGSTPANAGPDQHVCNQTQVTLAGNTISSGTATWYFVGGPNTPVITNPAQANTTVTGLVPGTYVFAYVVVSATGCPGSSDSVTIYNRPPVTPASAGNDTVVCNYTTTPLTLPLHGNTPANAGETGQWTIIQNTTGFTPVFGNVNQGSTSISNIRPGSITLVWTITNDAGCSPTSDTVSIRVYATPVAGTLSPGTEVCRGSNVTVTLSNYTGQIIKWRVKSAPLATSVFQDSAYTTSTLQLNNLQDSVAVQAIVGSLGLNDGCVRYDTANLVIPVSQPSIGGTTEKDSTYCQGTATGVITLSGQRGQILFWQSSTNNGANWGTIVSTANPLPFNNLLQTTWYRAVVKNGACPADTSDITKITVIPGTGAANAGPDQQLCALDSTRLTGNIVPGASYTWTQIAGPAATLGATNQNYLDVTGLQPNQAYQFMYELSNGVCPPAKDTVAIYNSMPLVNSINAFSDTVCAGSSYTITAPPASGGNGSNPIYQWQASLDGINFNNLAGANQQSYTFIASSDAWIRRIATIPPCSSASDTFFIKVQPGISNNTIASDAAVCINNPSPLITGSLPSGGNNVFNYQWQQSTDNGANWVDILGANGQNYNPGILAQTTQFRRNVSTDLCSGTQANTSNVVTITIRPDAEALFSPADTIGCAPYNLTPAVINLQTFPGRNSNYLWYADNVFIGSGSVFPGYTMSQSDDTVTIKLVTPSLYGCLADSISHQFITQKVALPSFTLSDTVGCGPLTVQIQNTTPEASFFTYLWDFGNGQTSTAVQPGSTVLPPNPSYGDTTYVISLTVFSACDTLTVTDSVRIKTRPKALFAPSTTLGCSPLSVVFNNTSLGGESYEWDFGDGTFFNTTSAAPITHVYHTGVRDTFYVRLRANGECGFDTLRYAIVVTPNNIDLDFAINGDEEEGCAPHTVHFINNSSGASTFHWDFGDGNTLNTTDNIDTVTHTYITPGNYTITLHASNGCSDTTATETVNIYPVPDAAFTANRFSACLGDTIRFTNQSTGATSYEWEFGDGGVSTLTNPTHIYSTPGVYRVLLRAFRVNSPGIVCTDTISLPVNIASSATGSFNVSDPVGDCAPFTVTFTNTNTPSLSAQWDFGDGNQGTGDIVTHTFTHSGTYTVTLTSVSPGGCTFVTTRQIQVLGPDGTFTYTSGYLCNNTPARFEATTINTDNFFWEFGDGVTLTTIDRIVYHVYANAGVYIPTVTFINAAGCRYTVRGVDTIKVDKIKAGFTTTLQRFCGYTTVNFTDTSHAYFGKAGVRWNFGDGSPIGTGISVSHQYNASGTYQVQQIVTGNSGCSDTTTRSLDIVVNNIPVASIQAAASACTNANVTFTGVIQSIDPVNFIHWTVSNGITGENNPFIVNFALPGNYIVQLIIGTANGCFDTATHQIRIDPSPVVTSTNNLNLCRGNSVQLIATGAQSYSWSPLQGLSCTNCSNPVASPVLTTPYVVQGTNQFGCSAYDTTVITVIQPFDITISPDDTICINTGSAQLLASGATSYQWSPAAGLSATDIPNPVASPTATTRYRVVGYDGFNCFTDTAFVLIVVGPYPVINLGPDQVLAAGTQFQLNPQVQNGPIVQWLWTPSANLSCVTCPTPVATIRNDITYIVRGANLFGCPAQDSINIKVFCQNSQVFIPNAFTPDHDGINDILTVRGTGIAVVKSFRIFNRWGELVFERTNFAPNDPAYGWDGRIKGREGEPAVFVYTAEVICDNGTPFTYKGNVSLLK